jgi:inorganic pyrophosphatase
MTNCLKFPTWADSGHVHVVVETPRGSRAKLEFDPKLGAFTLAKPLVAGLTYPYDWGFIQSTKAEDGDPLDVLIIHDASTYPGLVLTCKPIGVLEVLQSSKGKNERNDRVFVVPDRSPFVGDLQDIRRLPSRAIKESSQSLPSGPCNAGTQMDFDPSHPTVRVALQGRGAGRKNLRS